MQNKLKEALENKVLVFDGAMGTEIYRRNFFVNTSYENLCLTNPKVIGEIHKSYLDAGAEVLTANSYGANFNKLAKFGLAERLEEINRAAQKCSKKKDSMSDDEGGEGESSDGVGYLNDPTFLDIVELALNSGRIATSFIQRKMSIGYGRASKYIDIMEELGIVGEANGSKPRDVLITKDEWHEMLSRRSLDE